MMQMSIGSVVGAIKDAGNPFLRLINTVTSDNSTLNVPYFQCEQVKEAAFQSQSACETIHKGIHYRLDSTDDLVIRKCLELCRLLLLEGPMPSFQQLLYTQTSGKILAIANKKKNSPELVVPKDSVLEGNINLATAVHKGVVGDLAALAAYGVGNNSRSAMAGSAGGGAASSFAASSAAAGGAGGSYKSDFTSTQEREQKNFKKRREEERARKSGVVVNEKIFEQFDATLPPAKLVDYAVNHPKKKFADEELDNFVEAAEEGGKIEEVCLNLDKVLRDGKSPLQSRFKVLTIVDAMIRNLSPALLFFQRNNAGIYRHVALEAGDNPTKSAMMQQLSLSMMDIVHGKVTVPASSITTAAMATASSGAASVSSTTTFSPSPSPSASASAAPAGSAPANNMQQMAEMMAKMQAMQAQLLAAQSNGNTNNTTNSSASVGGGGWGGAAPAATATSNGWGAAPTAAASSSSWGAAPSAAATGNGWGAPAPAAVAPPSTRATSKPRDLLDDLFDTTTPAPSGPSTFGFGSTATSTTTNGSQQQQQLTRCQFSQDFESQMEELGVGEGGGVGVDNHPVLRAAGAAGPMLASEAAQEMVSSRSNNNNNTVINNNNNNMNNNLGPKPTSATAASISIEDQIKAMARMQQQMMMAGGSTSSNNVILTGASEDSPVSTPVAADAPATVPIPMTAVISHTPVSSHNNSFGGSPPSAAAATAAATAAAMVPAAASADEDPLVRMQKMQAQMQAMMAAMQAQQQQAPSQSSAQQQRFRTPSGDEITADSGFPPAAAEVYSPTTYYKDPYGSVAPTPGAETASRRATILRLMTKLEEQMSETKSVLADQQRQMSKLQEALMKTS